MTLGADDDAGLHALRQQREKLHNQSTEEIIRRGHRALLETLLVKSEDGSISVQEMAVLRNILRDNGMVLGVPPQGQAPGAEEPRPLPEFPEEYEHG